MMKPFPEQHDLIALFECEPELTDPGMIWAYNGLTFRSERGDDRIVCEIEPGYEVVKFEWTRAGDRLIHLELNWVSGLETELDGKREALIAHFRDRHLLTLRIQFKPHVALSWGTDVEPV